MRCILIYNQKRSIIMKKKSNTRTLRALALALALSVSALPLSACGQTASESQAAPPASEPASQTAAPAEETPAAEAMNLVTTTSQVLGGPTQMLQEKMTAAAAESDAFSFTHYDSSTLFKSAEEFQALVDHDVDVAFLSTSWFYDNGAKWCDMYASTYLFNSYQQVKDYFDPASDTGKDFQQKIYDEFHIWPIACFNLSVRDLWISKDRDVNGPEDLKGMLLRVPNGASWMKLGESLGASATTLDTNEVYLGLQTGTIDAQENNMISSYANSFQEVINTIVKTEHQYTFNLVCVAGDVWDALSEGQKAELTDIVVTAVDNNDAEIEAKEEEILKDCEENYGVRIQEPDLTAFREAAQEYYLNSPDAEYWDMDLYEQIKEMGKNYEK